MAKEKICPYNYPKGYKPIADDSCHYCQIKDFEGYNIYFQRRRVNEFKKI